MSGFITATGENYLLELISGVGYTLPAYFIALVKDQPPTRDIIGVELDEPLGLDYQRAYFENVSGNWTERVQAISNTSAITFPQCQDEPWGTITHWAVCDLSEGGRVLWAGELRTPRYIDIGDQVVIPEGGLSLRATNSGYGVKI